MSFFGMLARLLPARSRRLVLALAEIGAGQNGDLRLALLAPRRSLMLDVGANRGQYARFVAFLFDRVMVFEPLVAFASGLRTVLPAHCTIHSCALADFDGPASFHVPGGADISDVQTASLVAPTGDGDHRVETVSVRRLDDFALDEVSFIKVDVEGAEYAFLEGAKATIARCRPVMLIEIEDRHTAGRTERVFEFLTGAGYRVFVLQEDGQRRALSLPLRVLRGAAYAAGMIRVDVRPAEPRLAEVYGSGIPLNTAFGNRYVNNFLFVPGPADDRGLAHPGSTSRK